VIVNITTKCHEKKISSIRIFAFYIFEPLRELASLSRYGTKSCREMKALEIVPSASPDI
jgi:hypothetical protein